MSVKKKGAFLILRITQEFKDKLIKKASGKNLSAFARSILEKYLG